MKKNIDKNSIIMEQSIFKQLNSVNCNEHTEKKNGLTYLSWAWAWQMVKDNYPDATYKVYENEHGWNYFTDGRTCWVKTGVTIGDLEHIEYLPVMDFKNRSILLEDVTSFDVNKAIQRSITKAISRHGLGLYIYAGEDMPSEADDEARAEVKAKRKANVKRAEVAKSSLSPQAYYAIVKAYAEGRCTKSGGDYRHTWIMTYAPTPDEIVKFDADVDSYRAAMASADDMVAANEYETI